MKKEKYYENYFYGKVNKFSSVIIFILILILIFLFFMDFPVLKNSSLAHCFDEIDISVIPIEINFTQSAKVNDKNTSFENKIKKFSKAEQNIVKYGFDVEVGKTNFISDISLLSYFSSNNNFNEKIFPGTTGSFIIQLSTIKSMSDVKYKIKFEDVVNERPQNLRFKIKNSNKEYSNLQDLEKELIGNIEKNSIKQIIIEWNWPYESNNDEKDTSDGKNLTLYKFNILVSGEEVDIT